MMHFQSEQRDRIETHLCECLKKLKSETKSKLIRKFNSLSCNNIYISHVSDIPDSNLLHECDKDKSPHVTFLTSNSDLPNGTADLLDLGPKQTELYANVQLAKLAYRLRWKEIFTNSSESDNSLARPTYSEPQTVFEAIEHSSFEKPCRAPEVKFEQLESSLNF